MISTYAFTLLATIAVEITIAAGLTIKSRPNDILLVVLCANMVTHPITNSLIYGPCFNIGFWPVEALVVLFEFAIYRLIAGLTVQRAAVLASVTNAITIALS
ncbi:MAG: hypothetical protein OSA81_13580, partial [Longimicrobiales bacterium]|nr:hypothetical protein [Longimicrobiales bacterium]